MCAVFRPYLVYVSCTFAVFFDSLLLLLLLNAELLMMMMLQQQQLQSFCDHLIFLYHHFRRMHRKSSTKCENNKRSDILLYVRAVCCVHTCACVYIIHIFYIYVRDLDITDLCCIQFLHTKCRWIYISAVAVLLWLLLLVLLFSSLFLSFVLLSFWFWSFLFSVHSFVRLFEAYNVVHWQQQQQQQW